MCTCLEGVIYNELTGVWMYVQEWPWVLAAAQYPQNIFLLQFASNESWLYLYCGWEHDV